jgi:hypothetical protein
MFSTKFHPKPQTSDTVRRRRWQRVMQPIENITDYSRIFRFENVRNALRVCLKIYKLNNIFFYLA